MLRSHYATFATALLVLFGANARAPDKHEVGRCIMRGSCGKESFFSPELPCPDNGMASLPDKKFREMLIQVCGERYAVGPVCCDTSQLSALRENLKKAENLIASCPACKSNFFDFFCDFTCSPDQSRFLDISKTDKMPSGTQAVTGLRHYVDSTFADGFFESCRYVKFSATNGYVMDLIGGGASNGQDFLKFLGHKSLLGSPIQIDYPKDDGPEGTVRWNPMFKKCDDADPRYKCACVDCPSACPNLPAEPSPGQTCRIGIMPCLSFSVLFLYIASLVAFLFGYAAQLRYRKDNIVGRASSLYLDVSENLVTDLRDGSSYPTGLRTYAINDWLERCFYNVGFLCASFPYASIGLSFLGVAVLSVGWVRFTVETDPTKLWVSPTADVALQKDYFDTTFGPFYRSEQIFLTNATDSSASVLSYDTLRFWFELEDKITELRSEDGVGLQDLCFNPTGDACVIQSLTGYWQGQFNNVARASWSDDLQRCADQPVSCLPLFQQPLKPQLILGGYAGDDWLSSKALVSSFVLKNSLIATEVDRSSRWERRLQTTLLKAQDDARSLGLRLSFSTEASLEQELNKSSNTDATIVLISYLAMFLYVSVALGTIRWHGRSTIVHTKFAIGLFGILIVLLSISASVGLFSLLGVKVTLIIAEVIPFLVLAIGVDNVFLLCHDLDRINTKYPSLPIAQRVALATSRVGPSILMSASSETLAFALGAVVAMPAVRNFAIYAAGAVFFDAILQLVMFTAALAIDQRRVQDGRVDCLPCLRIDLDDSDMDLEIGHGFISRFMQRYLAPNLMKGYTQFAVLFLFTTWASISLGLLPRIGYGLNQKVALPRDSYLIDYFSDLENYFGIGPPVYFVVRQPNITERSVQQAICGRFTTCNDYSMANILEQERKRPEVSFLQEPAASWLDDFFYWLNPQLELCCRKRNDDDKTICRAVEPESRCHPCLLNRQPAWNITLDGMPEGGEFMDYIQAWLEASSSEDCPLAGKAPYGDALVIRKDGQGLDAFNTRSFHTPLRTQMDLIESYAAGKRIANELARLTGLDVFAYAIHYVYFAQYDTIVSLTFGLLAAAIATIFVIVTAALGSVSAAALLCITVCSMTLNIAGAMALFGISLNALSVVNLVVCVGIGVEFTAHLARAYMFPTADFVSRVLQDDGYREQRSRYAIKTVGPSVFTGITMCKFCGVVVLAFTQSKIFEIYYFRMWLALVFIAATHGLVLLPVLLSLFGPHGYRCQDEMVHLDAPSHESDL